MTGSARISYQPAILQLDLVRRRMWLADEIRPKNGQTSFICQREELLTDHEI